MHPRNLHIGGYNFKELTEHSPELKSFVIINKYGSESIDFANPEAVRHFNRAILLSFYKVKYWSFPSMFLCPPIPGRADYIHYLADLLSGNDDKNIPTGPEVQGLDIGVGANCIYPLIGQATYGWRFVGAEIDSAAFSSAEIIVNNNKLSNLIQIRKQSSPESLFKNIIKKDERFDFTMSNPPFHNSQEESLKGTKRKWKSLGKKDELNLNFGGRAHELWCEGGEKAFIHGLINESIAYSHQCLWFTCLVSKEDNLPDIVSALKKTKIHEYRIIPMTQGQKKSRIIAWTYFTPEEHAAWRKK